MGLSFLISFLIGSQMATVPKYFLDKWKRRLDGSAGVRNSEASWWWYLVFWVWKKIYLNRKKSSCLCETAYPDTVYITKHNKHPIWLTCWEVFTQNQFGLYTCWQITDWKGNMWPKREALRFWKVSSGKDALLEIWRCQTQNKLLGCPCPYWSVWIPFLILTPSTSFLSVQMLGDNMDCCGTCVPAIHVRDRDRIPGSYFPQPSYLER